MRATYHREMAVRDLLEQHHIDCYLPTKQKVKVVAGRKVCVSSPLVSSLIFVHSDKETLQNFKAKLPYLQYMTMPAGGKNTPIIVPNRQMDDFIAVTKRDNDRLLFYKPGEITFDRGTRVRVHGGVFDGVEGTFMKVAGKRNRRVVIQIQNVVAVAVECSDAELIETI